ncbi:MAG: PH domain-containing protein [Prochlorotrichaceae cyanobacterium]|jgi:hypothetical protein
MGIREVVFFEGKPHIGDLILNVILGIFIVTLPLTVGAIVRAIWVRFRITDRRVTVTGGWLGRERSDVIYTQIREVRTVPRGIGLWGDMVLILKDGSKLEMRGMPNFRAVSEYVNERIAQRNKQPIKASS